jgi:two-component system phosphate regulon sensor histidine kinase PhoR
MDVQNLEQQRPDIAALQALLTHLPDPIILVDSDTLVSEMNAAARALLPTLRLGQPLSFGLRTPDVLAAVAQATPGFPIRVDYREGGAAERIFAVEVTALKAIAAKRSGAMLFFRDLTEARRLERMRVDFIANVSHELRTPLTSLVGFIETLQGPARDDAAARERFLTIMQSQAWRMTRLVDDLLSLSRIELREHIAPNTSIDLHAVALQIIDTLAPMARERGVEISLDAAAGPLTVRGERDELLRIVENLVENAVKYGESGGRVDVTIVLRDGQVAFSVRDYGPGIAPEHLPRLTERFYRVDAAKSREKGGTGLGLAIVKHIVNRHRGRLIIESEPGKGAVFRVILPLAALASPVG